MQNIQEQAQQNILPGFAICGAFFTEKITYLKMNQNQIIASQIEISEEEYFKQQPPQPIYNLNHITSKKQLEIGNEIQLKIHKQDHFEKPCWFWGINSLNFKGNKNIPKNPTK